jgi:hypothetical protein
MNQLLGVDALVDWPGLIGLLARLALNLAFAVAVIRGIYQRHYQNRDYVFTYYTFNVITFCLCLLLRKVASPMGLALALFGVFGILRYRTEQIRIRDLTYLFIVIGIAVLNALGDRTVSVAELLAVNGVILGTTALLELGSSRQREYTTPLLYDHLELLRPGSEADLLADLREKLGLAVVRVEVNEFDLLRDAATITVFYRR